MLLAKASGATKSGVLPGVASGFHTPLIAPAAAAFRAAVRRTPMRLPARAVYSNVTGRPYASVAEIKARLVEQLTTQVQWAATLESLIRERRAAAFFELGPQKQLQAMMKRTDKQAAARTTSIAPGDFP